VSGLTWGAALAIGAALLALHLIAVALAQALRAYSPSRLEELCARRGRPRRAGSIERLDERTERAAELVSVVTGLGLAALLGAVAAQEGPGWTAETLVAVVLIGGAVGHLAAAVWGRAAAETLLDTAWPLADLIRRLAAPLTYMTRQIEAALYRKARRGAANGPRPASVEVEIHARPGSSESASEPELPQAAHAIIEHAVELTGRDVTGLMTPRSAIIAMPATATPAEAARLCAETGLSRIPLYGAHRDDIVGILYAKDLLPHLIDPACRNGNCGVRKLARPPLFVPETKDALELLDELRNRRVQMALVCDEFGTITGLVTLEDILEGIVGPIDDEHDHPTPEDPLVPRGESAFEVDAALSVEELNERLGLDLPTDADYQTVGGLAFDALRRVPEPGATFRAGGARFTVLEVGEHAIRRLRIDLNEAAESAA
jgi:CBS domain containing-hemolysin-like protein